MKSRLKQPLALLLALAMALSLMCGSAGAATVASGSCGRNGDNVTWSLDSSGTLTISGTGEMYWSSHAEEYGFWSPWSLNYSDSVKKVVIQSGITHIGDSAFYQHFNLESATIPDSVTSWEQAVFAFCESLKQVNIPSGLTKIPLGSFYGCSELSSVTIPDSVTVIHENAFVDCTSLPSITIPASVTTIGEYSEETGQFYVGNSFYGCTALKQITFKGDAPRIAPDTFTGVTATAYYPKNNATWTADKRQDYGGHITWIEEGSASHTHTYGNPVWSWAADGSSATATFTCVNGDDTQTLNAEITRQTTHPDCGATGKSVCTAYVSLGGKSYSDGKTVTLPATGNHTWNASTVTKAPTYTEEGVRTYTCTVCGKTKTESIPKLNRVNLVASYVTLSGTSFVYTGSPIEPDVTIKYHDVTLTEGKDYTLDYSNNVNPGTATVYIVGQGAFTGSVTLPYTIEEAPEDPTPDDPTPDDPDPDAGKTDIGDPSITISYVEEVTYFGMPMETEVQIYDPNGKEKFYLDEGKDYTLSYKNNDRAGTATVIITGIGDYTGQTTRTFLLKKGKNSIYVSVDYQDVTSLTRKWSAKKQTIQLDAFSFDFPKLTFKSSDPTNVAVSTGGKVTIKAGYVGKATITVTSPETDAYLKATVKIPVTVKAPTPKAAAISKLTNVKGKQMKATWKKVTNATGYEVQYTTDKKFKKGVKTVKVKKGSTVTATVKKLTKKKTYYVRIRTCQTANKKTYYSKWSAAKSVTIKK
jgi:hypothetical protein